MDPHHFDEDPGTTYRPDADADTDPDSDFLFDADPHPYPSFKKGSNS